MVVPIGWQLLAGLVGPVPVVMAGVLARDWPEVPFAVDQHPVGALGSCAAICAGRVPETPQQTGEMPYVIVAHADGRLIASVSMVRELAEGRSVLAQRLEPPHYEVQYRVAPAPGGTRLELTMCWPDAPVTDTGEQLRSRLAQALQQTASAYQAAIESGGTGQTVPWPTWAGGVMQEHSRPAPGPELAAQGPIDIGDLVNGRHRRVGDQAPDLPDQDAGPERTP